MSRRTDRDQVLQRVGQFQGASPELQAALSKLEDNVHKAVRAQHTGKAQLPQSKKAPSAEVQAKIGEVVLFDPDVCSTILLPKVGTTDDGQSVRLKNTSSAITATTVRAAAGQLIDGAATASISGAKAAYHLYTDGEGWHFL